MDIFDLIQQGKIKRYFRSRHKISYPGAINHITQRAPGREMLFIEEKDYLLMIHLLKSAAKKYKLKFFSFVLMPNHLHLLFQLNSDNLSRPLQYIFNNYANYFNRKYKRKGHVFCGRFRQALCFDESYLLASSVYIHLNPVVAGLVKNISDYRWSSVIPFIHKLKRMTFIDYKFILHLLNEDTEIARQRYKQLVDRSLEIKVGNLWDKPKTLELFRDKLMTPLKEIITTKDWLNLVSSIDSEIKNIKRSKHQRTPESFAARKYIISQLRARGYKISEIAQKLGLTRQAIYKTLRTK